MKQFGCFQLDAQNECLRRDGKQIPLAPKPFAVLRYLVENSQRLVTHDELLDALWPETYVQPQVLRTYVLDLRKLLGDDPDEPLYIQTVPKRGYRFVAAVSEIRRIAALQETESAAPPLAGRDTEIEKLDRDLECAKNGERKLIFLTGDAGSGKTSLLDAFIAFSGGEGEILVARGQSMEGFGGKEMLYPVREAFVHLASNEKTESLLEKALPAWFGSHETPGKSTPALAAICEALEMLAETRPLLLVLEDIHWADVTTLDLISMLGRRRGRARLMVVASYRPDEVAAQHPLKSLKEDLITRRLCCEIALKPLEKDAVRDYLLRQCDAKTLPAGLTSFVHQHSEGNPLFMVATFEHLVSQRLILCENKSWKLAVPLAEMELGIPEGLSGMIELQLERLTESERRLLEAGSIVGTIFPAWAAAAALKSDVLEIEDEYATLARRTRLLNAAGQDELPDGARSTFYVFSHNLFREALYARQPAAVRAERHRRVAGKLKEIFAENEVNIASLLASHYEAAGDWKNAILALMTDAEAAGKRGADHAARETLSHVMELSGNLKAEDKKTIEKSLAVWLKKYPELVSAELA